MSQHKRGPGPGGVGLFTRASIGYIPPMPWLRDVPRRTPEASAPAADTGGNGRKRAPKRDLGLEIVAALNAQGPLTTREIAEAVGISLRRAEDKLVGLMVAERVLWREGRHHLPYNAQQEDTR